MIYVLIIIAAMTDHRSSVTVSSMEFASLQLCEAAKTWVLDQKPYHAAVIKAECKSTGFER